MSADNEAIVRGYFDAWNARDWAAARAAYLDDAVMEVPGTGERFEGADAIVAVEQAWARAFPDGRITIDHVTVAGDTVVVEYTGRGTHTGPLQGPDGEIPPTGRSGQLGLCDVLTLRDGRIQSVREYYDTFALLTQLGLVPEPAGSAG